MRITHFIIGMVLISGVIIGMYNFQDSLVQDSSYNITINNTSYKERYNKLDKLKEISSNLQNKTAGIESEKQQRFFTGVWDAFKIGKDVILGAISGTTTAMGLSFDFATSFVGDIGLTDESGYLGVVMVTILTILVVGAILYMILKVKI